jgi:hypothetical protein
MLLKKCIIWGVVHSLFSRSAMSEIAQKYTGKWHRNAPENFFYYGCMNPVIFI